MGLQNLVIYLSLMSRPKSGQRSPRPGYPRVEDRVTPWGAQTASCGCSVDSQSQVRVRTEGVCVTEISSYSFSVCCVLCTGCDLGVSCGGVSDEMWRLCLSTLKWTRIPTGGSSPSPRRYHVMTAVGMDLWVHGGTKVLGEGDICFFFCSSTVSLLWRRC